MLMGFILGLGFDIRVRVSERKVAMTDMFGFSINPYADISSESIQPSEKKLLKKN